MQHPEGSSPLSEDQRFSFRNISQQKSPETSSTPLPENPKLENILSYIEQQKSSSKDSEFWRLKRLHEELGDNQRLNRLYGEMRDHRGNPEQHQLSEDALELSDYLRDKITELDTLPVNDLGHLWGFETSERRARLETALRRLSGEQIGVATYRYKGGALQKYERKKYTEREKREDANVVRDLINHDRESLLLSETPVEVRTLACIYI